MSFRLYVGNYPSDFTREDVLHLFRDFDGFIIEKFIKRDKKCFSFCHCADIDQLVSIIKSKNNVNVFGRKLKVRAVEDSLQDYVDLLIKDTNDDIDLGIQSTPAVRSQKTTNECVVKQNSKDCIIKKFENSSTPSLCEDEPSACQGSSRIPLQVTKSRKCDEYANNFESSPTLSSSFVSNKHCNGQIIASIPSQVTTTVCAIKQNYKDVAKCSENFPTQSLASSVDSYDVGQSLSFVPLQVMKNQKCEKVFHKNVKSTPTQSCSSAQNSYSASSKEAENQKYEKDITFFENSPTSSLSSSSDKYGSFTTDHSNKRLNFAASRNTHAKTSFPQKYQNDELSWVSFTNFPFGTSIKAIYELFSDFDPLQVKMICNRPTTNKLLTEAHVSFRNQSVATDVILNFDNTMFNGRLVLVTDVEDLTIMNELLDLHFSSYE